MDSRLEKKLFKKYPEFFSGKDLPLTESLMSFGIECGDGWFDIIVEFCSFLYEMGKRWSFCDYDKKTKKDKEPESKDRWFRFTQIKEKYGTLRLYYTTNSKTYDDMANIMGIWADWKSENTCEVCGDKGSLNTGDYWLKVRCTKHKKD